MEAEKVSASLENSNCIARVVCRVSSGKEADVYCCQAHDHLGVELVAAKVFRPLETRGFRNDSVYRQGRFIKDERLRRACRNKSRTGRIVQFNTWVLSEYETLGLLHTAGARVPAPYEFIGDTIVMQYIGSEELPAPTLNRVRLTRDEAAIVSREILEQVRLWLSCGRIHADLSPYNILYLDGEITVIDFPQSVDPRWNPDPFDLLLRDLERIATYFGRLSAGFDAPDTARRIWNAAGYAGI
jgi:RIO kinase 1